MVWGSNFPLFYKYKENDYAIASVRLCGLTWLTVHADSSNCACNTARVVAWLDIKSTSSLQTKILDDPSSFVFDMETALQNDPMSHELWAMRCVKPHRVSFQIARLSVARPTNTSLSISGKGESSFHSLK